MAYRHIMVGIDVSDEALDVLQVARGLADEHSAKLSVCTVVKPLTHVYGGLDMLAYTQASVNFEQEAAEQARRQVEAVASTVGIAPADVHVFVGVPAVQIVEAAEALDADLVVVGSHGKHGFGLLLGSTANGVLHKSACDVLTVRIGKH